MKDYSQNFIKRANIIHEYKYDYSNVVYVNSKTPVEIICSHHGSFYQRPIYHIQRKSGCPLCYKESRQYDKTSFLTKAKHKFGDRFLYGEYGGFRRPIQILCRDHGWFTTTPSNHLLNSGGCKQCRRKSLQKPYEVWIAQFNATHNNFYSYDKNITIKSNDKIVVTCPIHGDFNISPSNHYRGGSCPRCAASKYVGGYSHQFFELYPHKKHLIATFYVIQIFDEMETFFKVGITTKTIEERFKSRLPYDYKIIKNMKMTLYEAHLLETQILKTNDSYTPKKQFAGWTECIRNVDNLS